MRIRSIKPEFWRSDDIDALSIPDRLLFIGLWSYVDDSGVGADREASIAADLFAGDLSREPHETSVRVHGGLMRLQAAGLITRYSAQGKRWLHISNWTKHQKINRATESSRPGPTSEDAVIHEPDSEGSVSPHAESPLGTGEQGNRGTGEETLSRTARLDDGFDDFWAGYPKKVDKQKAKKAWRTARRRGVPAERLINQADAYAHERAEQDSQFTKNPATWLNAGAYDNEPRSAGHLRAVSGGHQPWQNPPDDSVYLQEF